MKRNRGLKVHYFNGVFVRIHKKYRKLVVIQGLLKTIPQSH